MQDYPTKPTNQISFSNTSGQEIIRIGTTAENTSGIVIFDDKGNPRLDLSLTSNDIAEMAFYDQNGRDRVKVASGRNGESTIQIHSSTGYISIDNINENMLISLNNNNNTRMTISSEKNGNQGIYMFDDQTRPTVQITTNQNNEPTFALFDSFGRGRMAFGLKQDGSVGFDFNDLLGNQKLSFGLLGQTSKTYWEFKNPNEFPSVIVQDSGFFMFDKNGNIKLRFGINNFDCSFLEMVDENGEIINQIPERKFGNNKQDNVVVKLPPQQGSRPGRAQRAGSPREVRGD